jgi:hypothetical protein
MLWQLTDHRRIGVIADGQYSECGVTQKTKEIYPVKCKAYFTGTRKTKETNQTKMTG